MRRLAILLLACAASALAADAARGQHLHDKQCVSCHAKQYGGNGTAIYLRTDRLIHDRQALEQRVATCNKMTGAGLSANDEKDISAYLQQRFYHFDE
jgi:mono/diheme cytochrome c family protein